VKIGSRWRWLQLQRAGGGGSVGEIKLFLALFASLSSPVPLFWTGFCSLHPQ
jgi:hypothetical protein